MKKIFILLFICVPVIGIAQQYKTIPQKSVQINTSVLSATETQFAREKIMRLRAASLDLLILSEEAIPNSLNTQQLREAQNYSRWLKSSSTNLDTLADRWELELITAIKGKYTRRKMQELNYSFNIKYLGLQQKMQSDNRQFTSLSNIMKTKHDAAKAAINNVR